MIKRIAILFLIGLHNYANSKAQNINTNKLDSLFNILSSKNLMMGSISISKDNKIVYKKSFGFRYIDGDKKILADENTKYRVGSVTKLFTSVMIFQLVEEGKLSLNEKLSTFFPQIKNAEKITIEDMMRHRSGIHSFTSDSLYDSYYTKPQSVEAIVQRIAQYDSDFEPTTKYAYSNSNYYLLGCIVEKLDKRNYNASLKKRITNKLQLSNTSLGEKINVFQNVGQSYLFKDNKWILSPETDMSVPVGAGAIISTPTDLNTFLNGLFDKKLIGDKSLSLDTLDKGGFGMDIYRVPFYDRYGYGHGGDIDGFHTDLFKFLTGNITVAICYNGVNYSTNDILIAILSSCFGRPFELSSLKESIHIDTVILHKYTGLYSSKTMPLKIKVFVEKSQLYAQAVGQGAIPLNAISEKEFVFKPAKINILFDADKQTFVLKQNGAEYLYTKE